MPYSNEIFHTAKSRINDRRQQALRAADYRREQLYREIPRLEEIASELSSVSASIAKFIIKPNGDNDIEMLRDRSLALQKEREQLLTDAGISPYVLEPLFHCEKCSDTGYIELDNRTIVCDCLFRMMADVASEQLNANLPLKSNTFDSFKLDYYSDEPDDNGRSPLNRMSKIYNYCRSYADTFTPRSKSLLMRGATGLGKTHLSLAIANEVIEKGASVIYVTAPDILSKLEREHFTHQYQQNEDTFNSLLKADLLIIDDLGTEFITPFTISCVYNMVNSRLLSGSPTIISTNLSLSELITTYSQRFVSRLIGSYDRLDFLGTDIRTGK